ncbi:MAG: transposase [Candidatus Heimdallarchaeota archaeon]
MTKHKKPQQGQVSDNNKELDCSSLAGQCYNGKNVAQFLGKSHVTFSLWKRQGKITPDHYHGKRGYYSQSFLKTYQAQLTQSKTDASCPADNGCFDITQTAQYLNKSPQTIYQWIKKNQITPDHKVGRSFHFTASQLQTFQHAYKISSERVKILDPNPSTPSLANANLETNPPLLTTPTYETEALIPFKTQSKIIDVLITGSTDQPQLLFMFLGMLIAVLIKLIIYTQSGAQLLIPAFQLQEEYLQLQSQQHQITPQGIPMIDPNDTTPESQSSEKLEKLEKLETTDASTKINSEQKVKKKYYGLTLWQKAVDAASSIFLKLTQLTHDYRLDDEERKRGRKLLNKIFGPYLRLTKYITKYEPRTARHDVAFLLLAKRPKDYGIDRIRWSTRLLAKVCEDLGTKNAKRSTVGNILKELKWNCSIKPKLISPDPEYGPIIFHLGMVFNTLGPKDRVVFNDEFKFTSSKIAEYLKKKQAPAGWDITLPFGLHRPFYKTKAAIKISGLLTGKSKKLLVKELKNENFDGYYKVLTGLLDEVLGEMNGGKLYLIVDNAPNHQPNILRSLLLKKYDRQVEVLILPRYSPNHNPIEGIWKYLLEVTERAGNTEDELRGDLEISVNTYNRSSQNKAESPLQLHCEICGKKWQFSDDTESRIENELSLKKHLCFRIEGLNPYIIYVLTHSLEMLQSIDSLENLEI